MPPSSKSATTTPVEQEEVIYQNIMVSGVPLDDSQCTITKQNAIDLLGWEQETDDVKFGNDYLLTLDDGVKVRCVNNSKNRPLDEPTSKKYAQDILKGHWRLNGETIVIGRNGQVLSGQHRLIALILACIRWEKDQHFREVWPEEPTLRTITVFGVEESKDVTRTLDNVRTRTLADVLFSDGEVFSKTSQVERRQLCKIIDSAIRFVWHRTGAKDAYSTYRTHSESLDFLNRHPRLLKSVKLVWEQNSTKTEDNRLGCVIPLGILSGLHYLMGASATKRENYIETHSEQSIDFANWKVAEGFINRLADGSDGFARVAEMVCDLKSPDGSAAGPIEEKEALLVNAWLIYISQAPLTAKSLGYVTEKRGDKTVTVANGLQYNLPLDDPDREMTFTPSVGGIDLGDPGEEERLQREREKEEERERKEAEREAAKAEKALDAEKLKMKKLAESETHVKTLQRLRTYFEDKFDNSILLFPHKELKYYMCYGSDAVWCAEMLGEEAKDAKDLKCKEMKIPAEKMDVIASKKGVTLIVCGTNEVGLIVGIGTYTKGGHLEFPAESPKPAEPLPPVSTKKPVPAKKEETSKANPAPQGKGKGQLKGGTGK